MDPTTQRLIFAATNPPAAITFTANNYYPAANTSVTLAWNVLNSASVSINQAIGAVNVTGSAVVIGVNVTRTYTLTAAGLDGISYTSSITVAWAAAPPPPKPSYCATQPDWAGCE